MRERVTVSSLLDFHVQRKPSVKRHDIDLFIHLYVISISDTMFLDVIMSFSCLHYE